MVEEANTAERRTIYRRLASEQCESGGCATPEDEFVENSNVDDSRIRVAARIARLHARGMAKTCTLPRDLRAERRARRIARDISLGDYAQYYLGQFAGTLADETRDDYELYAAQLAYYFDDLTMADLEPSDVEWLKEEVGERDGHRTKFNHLNGFLQLLCDRAEIDRVRPADSNPCRAVSRYPAVQRTHHLTPEQRARYPELVQQLVLGGVMTVQAGGLLLIMFYTGLRWSDARYLMWSECFLDAPEPYLCIKARCPKRARSKNYDGKKRIYISEEARACIRSMPRISEYVAPNPKPRADGTLRPYTEIRKQRQRLYDLLGLTWSGYHGLRHTVGTCAANAGASQRQVMELLGHSHPNSAHRYMHPERHAMSGVICKMTRELLGPARVDEVDGSLTGNGHHASAPLRRPARLHTDRTVTPRPATAAPQDPHAGGSDLPDRPAHAPA